MRPRHLITTAVLTLAVSGACGSSGVEPEPTNPPDETEATEPANVTAPEVGRDIEGTAVATSAGGEEACKPQPEGLLPNGLVEGAPVTIRDASSDEVIGTGEVTSTDFVQHQQTEGQLPPWTCTFIITATVSSTPDSFTVQVADLTPLPATVDPNGRFTVTVPSATEPTPDTTAPPEPSSSTTVSENGSTSTTVFENGSTSSTVVP